MPTQYTHSFSLVHLWTCLYQPIGKYLLEAKLYRHLKRNYAGQVGLTIWGENQDNHTLYWTGCEGWGKHLPT